MLGYDRNYDHQYPQIDGLTQSGLMHTGSFTNSLVMSTSANKSTASLISAREQQRAGLLASP